MWTVTTLICTAGTVLAYLVIRALYMRYRRPFINVVGLSAGVVIMALLALDIPYDVYDPAKRLMTTLMGAATVSLALPLYRYRKLLVRHMAAIGISVACGALASMFSAGLMVQAGGLPREVVISILSKGVSIPFAVEIAEIYGGSPPLAAAFVVATGTLGSLLGAWGLGVARIRQPFSRGLTLGAISHAQGTAVALEEGEEPGAMAGLAMILAGIFTAALAPLAVWLLDSLAG